MHLALKLEVPKARPGAIDNLLGNQFSGSIDVMTMNQLGSVWARVTESFALHLLYEFTIPESLNSQFGFIIGGCCLYIGNKAEIQASQRFKCQFTPGGQFEKSNY